MFLLICDLAINPSEGFPCDLQHVPSVILSIDPGMRFLLLCHAVAREKASFLGAITSYSKAEYLDVSGRLCKALVCEPPVRIAETIAAWAKEHSTFAQLLIEEDTHEFSAGNLPIRVFFAQFLRFQLDKLADPQFFCWPGMWMCERAGTWDLENSQRLFNRHEALFMDGPDGDVYPRVLRNKNAKFVTRTFDAFYSNVAAYELTRQWIVEDGPFELDFLWLTSQYSRAEVGDWASHIFEQSFGVRPDAFRIL
jgi:hypothetical protein